MLNLLRAGARFFQNHIGWNRIGVLLSLAIIAVAVVVLVHMLRDINVDEVVAAMKATERRTYRRRRRVRRRRLFHAHVLRLVCVAHDRAQGNPLSDRGAVRIHQLFDRPQYRRHRVHRRCGALPHLFGLRSRRHRGGENLFRGGPDVLARQRHRTGSRHLPFAAGRGLARSTAGLAQPLHRGRDAHRCSRPISAGSGARRARSGGANGKWICRAGRPPCCRSASAFSISAVARSPCTCCCRTSRISVS